MAVPPASSVSRAEKGSGIGVTAGSSCGSSVRLRRVSPRDPRRVRRSAGRGQPAVGDALGPVGLLAQACAAGGPRTPGSCPRTTSTWLSPSKARMWVAMRSRNQRSWRDDHRAAGERRASASSSARSVSTSRSLVGSSSSSRLPPPAQQLGQVDAVALAARELAHALLLVGALEVERGDVGARVDILAPAELDQVLAARDLLATRSCRPSSASRDWST